MVHKLFLSLLVSLSVVSSTAQVPVPMDSTMRMVITARDTDLLMAYNIYTAEIGEGEDRLSVDFLVLKNEDTFSRKSYILGQLTPVEDFILVPDGKERNGVFRNIAGIEVSTPKGLNKQAYLNFDPMLPDPIFMLNMHVGWNAR